MAQPDVRDAPLLDRGGPDAPAAAVATSPSHSGVVVCLVGAGLLLTCLGDALARAGHEAPALPMFFVGLLGIFVPCAWRLLSSDAARSERVAVSLVLGIALLASYYVRSPLIFDWFDELIHGATLNSLLRSRTLVVHNGILPVSPYYPGLELLTIAVKWMTGLPAVLAQLVVVLAQRVVLVLCLFLVVERIFRSARAAGIAVLVYVANPSFYTFASWDYGCLALAFAVAAVHFVLSSLDASPEPTAGLASHHEPRSLLPDRGFFVAHRDLLLALASLAALTVTHHLTAWLTAGLLVVWSLGLWIDRRPKDARVVGLAAAASIVMVSGWTAFVGSHLVSYLGPIFSDAASGFSSAVGQQHTRSLFHTDSNQGGSSPWEVLVMLGAAASFCLLLCPSGLAVIRRRTALRGTLRFLPVAVAAAYPVAMLASISSGSSQVGERTTTFIFFGMAVVIGGWFAAHVSGKRGPLGYVAVLSVATVCFFGGLVFGSGPDITYVPGPYLVAANQRSVSAPSLAVAQWASTHLVAGSDIAADRQSGALVADFADVNLVTSIGGYTNPGPLFFSAQFDSSDLSLIRRDHIRYIVVDRRLASSLPLFGTYFEAGEARPGTRLTVAELGKFDSVPGIDRIYDNGPIQVYDTSRLLGVRPSSATLSVAAPSGLDVVVLAAAVLVAAVGTVRVRRRRGRSPITDHNFVRWVVGSMVVGMAVAAVMIPAPVPPTVIGLMGLALLLVVILLATRPVSVPPSDAPPGANGARRAAGTGPDRRAGRDYSAAGVALAIVVTGIALARRGRRRGDSPRPQG